MHLGLSTYTFPWSIELSNTLNAQPFSFLNMLEIAEEHQIKYFQFGDNYPLHILSDEALEELKETALAKNIFLQIGTRGLTYENIHRYLTIAQTLNSEFLRVVIDDTKYQPNEAETICQIKQLLPTIEETGVKLAIENHDRFKAKSLAAIIKATDEKWVAICLDTANSLGAAEGIAEVAAVLLPYTINVHIKDFTIERVNHKMGFNISGKPAGSGMLNIPWLINECSKYAACKTATLELWLDKEKTSGETLQKEKEWVNSSIQYLNKYIQ